MNKRDFVVLALIGGALLPANVEAKAIEELSLAADANDLVISVISDEPLKTPTIRTGSGVIRVRFYDVANPTNSKVEGDGSALRNVQLTRGSDGTAAIAIMLGDHTKLAPADVRVEPDGDVTNLRIARGLLPPLSDSPNIVLAADKPVATAQPATQQATEAAKTEVAPAPVAEQKGEAPATLGKPKPAGDASAEPQKLTGVGSSSLIPVLITISLMLALSYAALQVILRRRRNFGTDIPVIDVVAQQQLGPKHQLVIVRAFDRDYLLSIQGTQTTVVARSSRKKAALEAAAAVEAATGGRSARRAELTDALRQPASRDFEEDDEPTFGGELFKHALEQRERAREQTANASQAIERARSQAASLASERISERVAERVSERARDSSSMASQRAREQGASHSPLERTRDHAFGFASERPRSDARSEFDARLEIDRGVAADDGRILGNDTSRTRPRAPEAERRSPPISERVLINAPAEDEQGEDGRVSDSVSGLLRLRKQAGR